MISRQRGAFLNLSVLVGLALFPAGAFLIALGFGAFSNASAQVATSAERTQAIAAAPHDGQHDFDFHVGTWKTHLWRLLHPLTGSNTWVEYEGTTVVRKVWNGRANLVELESRPARPLLQKARAKVVL
jgi:hypothetical protein